MILLTVCLPSAGITDMWHYAPPSFSFLVANGHFIIYHCTCLFFCFWIYWMTPPLFWSLQHSHILHMLSCGLWYTVIWDLTILTLKWGTTNWWWKPCRPLGNLCPQSQWDSVLQNSGVVWSNRGLFSHPTPSGISLTKDYWHKMLK